MRFQKVTDKDETELVEIPKTPLAPKPELPTGIVEEDASSLWQYVIHEKGNFHYSGILLATTLGFFYFCSFYSVFAQLLEMPITTLTSTTKISNTGFIWVAKIFFLLFLLVQAETECIDGWRMVKFAQGTRKTTVFVGSVQFFYGFLVELISFSLMHRSQTIFNLMAYSATLTVFLRMDDVFTSWMTKMFPQTKIKVKYDKGRQEKDSRIDLIVLFAIKMIFFFILEISCLFGASWII